MPKRKDTEFTKVNLRLQEGLRRRLEHEAKSNHVSLNSEMLQRLERSFDSDQKVIEMFGGEHNLALLKLIGSAISFIEHETGKKWTEDALSYLRISRTITQILGYMRAGREITIPAAVTAATRDLLSPESRERAIKGLIEKVSLVSKHMPDIDPARAVQALEHLNEALYMLYSDNPALKR